MTPADQQAIAQMIPLLEKLLEPATPEQFAMWIEFLVSRYRAREDSPSFAVLDKRVWLAVIGHWPLDVLEAAVVQWCAEDRPFAPSVPGELKPLGESIVAYRAALLELARYRLTLEPVAVRMLRKTRDDEPLDFQSLTGKLVAGVARVHALPPTRSPAIAARFHDGAFPQAAESIAKGAADGESN